MSDENMTTDGKVSGREWTSKDFKELLWFLGIIFFLFLIVFVMTRWERYREDNAFILAQAYESQGEPQKGKEQWAVYYEKGAVRGGYLSASVFAAKAGNYDSFLLYASRLAFKDAQLTPIQAKFFSDFLEEIPKSKISTAKGAGQLAAIKTMCDSAADYTCSKASIASIWTDDRQSSGLLRVTWFLLPALFLITIPTRNYLLFIIGFAVVFAGTLYSMQGLNDYCAAARLFNPYELSRESIDALKKAEPEGSYTPRKCY